MHQRFGLTEDGLVEKNVTKKRNIAGEKLDMKEFFKRRGWSDAGTTGQPKISQRPFSSQQSIERGDVARRHRLDC